MAPPPRRSLSTAPAPTAGVSLGDPSPAAGIASLIPTLSRASIAAGADGVAVEVHPDPSVARSDAEQALGSGELATIVAEARIQAAVTGRGLHT